MDIELGYMASRAKCDRNENCKKLTFTLSEARKAAMSFCWAWGFFQLGISTMVLEIVT